MDKTAIIEILEDIAVLLELEGENPFKIRAYQNGARALEGFEGDLDAAIADEALTAIPGIGEAIAEKVATLRRTGRLPFHENLRSRVPAGLLDLLELPGLGPKKIRKLHTELGVDSIASLQAACDDGRVAALAGFGAKTVTNLKSAIANREAWSRRHLNWTARSVAAPILAGLLCLPEVRRAEAAGSLRRGLETIGDLDFLVASDTPAPIMDWFVHQADVAEVTARGETKSSVRLQSGLQADLRVVPEAQFAYALHHFTGSKAHNVKLRQRALARGYSLSEWGLSDKDHKEQPLALGIQSEEELFQFLGLHFIPPELREGHDELELAEQGPFPRLLEVGDLRGALHNHTTASDGADSLESMIRAAGQMGWDWIGIADHSKSSFQAHGLNEERLLRQVAEIRAWNEAHPEGPLVLAGSEVDILRDGSLDFADAVLAQLDYCVISVHAALTGLSEAEMTDRVIRAIEHPLPIRKILGHPTGRLLLRRDPYAIDLRRIIDACAANGVWIELNASPLRLDLDWRHWRLARERGVGCIINPDAHAVAELAQVHAGVVAARKAALRREDVLNRLDRDELRRALR